ncbi:helix-turn-helix transcriptional regulator [Gordonia jinhuaensis]|uniref:Transcriptional regulatory protein n=1 Tax=Gordonia jinhuaensis TaxID=1517702 RepID=A0A916T287_9ACTN|nr:helix-turn-helix transcriptional regulator [Gordonia jinhuaensis]GGB28548.1 putative transcriptional regulatory protein [Gordonia jinhuaensis]
MADLTVMPTARAVDPLLREVIGDTLRDARKRQGRTLKEVAGEAGVSVTYLSEVERGQKEASSEVVAAVTRALGGSMIDLLTEMTVRIAPQVPAGVGAESAALHAVA